MNQIKELSKFSNEDLIAELTRRAVEADVVDSESQFCLLALKSMSESEKNNAGNKIEGNESFINLENFVEFGESTENAYLDKQLKKAYEFGISYVNGY